MNEVDDAYEDGYEAGMEAGRDSAWQEGYDEAMEELTFKKNGKVDNLCLKCDCKQIGLDCILDDPRQYMENRLANPPVDNVKDTSPPPKENVTNTDFDYAMEIFD